MSSRIRRALLRIAAAILVLAVLLASVGVYLVRRPFPQTTGSIRVQGLDGPVDVYRDSFGVPHIYGSTEHDLFMAQGFVHAQDRFWQMDFWRHVAAGRLSEMFGESQLETDMFLRTLGWERVARQEWEMSDPAVRAALEAYAEGVNVYLATRRGSELSLEHAILGMLTPGYAPEPWSPVHALTWAKVMAWDLRGNMDEEIERARLVKKVGAVRTAELYLPYPADHPLIAAASPPGSGASAFPASGLEPALASLDLAALHSRVAGLDALLGAHGDGVGSNSWAVSPERSAAGGALLANDPHLGIQLPSIWYEVGLHCRPKTPQCPWDLVGYSFAGVPGVVLGHNDRIAWGFTNLGPDVMDLYIEKVNPDNPDQYAVNGEWVDMDLVQETIQVAGGDPVTITVRYTRHGPVLSDVHDDLADFTDTTDLELPTPFAVSLRWTALDPGRTLEAVLGFNRAQNWEEFRAAAGLFVAPSQNLIYADVDGNIGYQMPGLVPIRAAGNGMLPVPGWTDEFEWAGFIPFEALPFAFNPPEGYIVTANNAVVGPEYPYLISLEWDAGYRAARIVQLLSEKETFTVQDMTAIQGDNHNPMGPLFVPLLRQLSWDDPQSEAAVELLTTWNFQNHMNSAPAAVFNAFWRHLVLQTFSDELEADEMPGGSRSFAVMANLAGDPQNPWWDDVSTPAVETRDDILRRGLEAAIEELQAVQGGDPNGWRWGDLHTATFENQSLGRSGVAPIEALFNRGPFPTSGGFSIVNATSWRLSQGYAVTSLPSMRSIYDLADFDQSLAIHTAGQSGHAFHPHYIDMADPWRMVQYPPMLWSPARVEAGAEAHLTLLP